MSTSCVNKIILTDSVILKTYLNKICFDITTKFDGYILTSPIAQELLYNQLWL